MATYLLVVPLQLCFASSHAFWSLFIPCICSCHWPFYVRSTDGHQQSFQELLFKVARFPGHHHILDHNRDWIRSRHVSMTHCYVSMVIIPFDKSIGVTELESCLLDSRSDSSLPFCVSSLVETTVHLAMQSLGHQDLCSQELGVRSA